MYPLQKDGRVFWNTHKDSLVQFLYDNMRDITSRLPIIIIIGRRKVLTAVENIP